MRNKNQIKIEIGNNKNVLRTIKIMSANKSLQKALKAEFVRMVKFTQTTIKYALNDREVKDAQFSFVNDEINSYIDAFTVHCKCCNVLKL